MNVHYRYLYNSDGKDVQNSKSSIFVASGRHIPTLDGYRKGDKLTLAWESEVNELDGRGYVLPTKRLCERLFQEFNAPWERPEYYAGPSMSIGDIVILYPDTDKAIAFACASVGFEQVEVPTEFEQRPTRWMRTHEQVREYRKAKAEDGY
jgi:hypothetical protein